MSGARLFIGSATEVLSAKLSREVEVLSANCVSGLSESLRAEVEPTLPPHVPRGQGLSGLRLNLKEAPSIAHSGWLFARYLDRAKQLGVEGSAWVAVCTDGLFREFEQFSVQSAPALFIGLGQNGASLLQAILDAERQFNPGDFDADGYVR